MNKYRANLYKVQKQAKCTYGVSSQDRGQPWGGERGLVTGKGRGVGRGTFGVPVKSHFLTWATVTRAQPLYDNSLSCTLMIHVFLCRYFQNINKKVNILKQKAKQRDITTSEKTEHLEEQAVSAKREGGGKSYRPVIPKHNFKPGA